MEIEIKVISEGKEIDRIKKPLSLINGTLSVSYKGKIYPVKNNKIELIESPAIESNVERRGVKVNQPPHDLRRFDKTPSPLDRPQTDMVREDKFHKDIAIEKSTTDQQKSALDSRSPKLSTCKDKNSMEPDWDESQIFVIECDPDARITVQAGPGTGKTAVACARVAWLVDHENIAPNSIWLISFTRTAVSEIRNRIRDYLSNSDDVYSIKIATIDSHAWSIHSGFDNEARLIGKYEENIEGLINLIKVNEGVGEYLEESVGHLIVDEAQDIVGIRADLILEIINRLSKTCGVTVFSDDAQAIYGFAMDEENINPDYRLTLSEKLKSQNFDELELDTVHRTKSPSLKKIFCDLRKKVLQPRSDINNSLYDIKKEVENIADERIANIDKAQLEELNDCFILFRRRAEVLQQSSFFEDKPHRIRMSGMPICIHPWVGACLSEHTHTEVTRTTFNKLWQENVNNCLTVLNEEAAWKQMLLIAGTSETSVSITRLRQRLGSGAPPAQFCSNEIGMLGPIIGTIHASKGREANRVYLMLPLNNIGNADEDEETRVVFVGATRSREKLLVGYGYRQYADSVDGTGRVYSLKTSGRQPRAQLEIGIEGDIKPSGIAGNYFSSVEDIQKMQNRLLNMAGKISLAQAYSDHGNHHVYRIVESATGIEVAVLSEQVNNDLFSIGNKITDTIRDGRRRRPPEKLDHLRIFGIRTLVLPPDSIDCNGLRYPWSKSGIMLAPVILGYTTSWFPNY